MSKSKTVAQAAQAAAPADVGAAPGGDDGAAQQAGTADAGADAGADDSGAGADQAGTSASDAGAPASDAGTPEPGGDQTTSPPARPERMRAVVLFSGAALSHRVGTVVEGPADVVERLQIAGDVDAHPGAVEAALAGGGDPVSLE